jgi:hypothetical protein
MARPTVTMHPVEIEVPCTRNGRPSYRWTTGYTVINPKTGAAIYPPVVRREAYALARELAPGCRVEIGQHVGGGK